MVFDHPAFDAHEEVLFCHDPATGLRGIARARIANGKRNS